MEPSKNSNSPVFTPTGQFCNAPQGWCCMRLLSSIVCARRASASFFRMGRNAHKPYLYASFKAGASCYHYPSRRGCQTPGISTHRTSLTIRLRWLGCTSMTREIRFGSLSNGCRTKCRSATNSAGSGQGLLRDQAFRKIARQVGLMPEMPHEISGLTHLGSKLGEYFCIAGFINRSSLMTCSISQLRKRLVK